MGQPASVRQVGKRSSSKPMAAAAAKVGTAARGYGEAGGGGFAGAGGSATLTLGNATTPGILKASGNFGHGAVVQSVGGGGGNGGSAGFFGTGGAGAAGGDGGQVTVNAPKPSTVATSVFVTGTNSIALLAQSVGGGGGVGGDATGLAIGGGVAIGGNGGLGGNGGPVTLNLAEGVFASTYPRCGRIRKPTSSAARVSWRRASAVRAAPAAVRP